MEVTIIMPGKNPVRLSPAAAGEQYPGLRGPIALVTGLGFGAVARFGGTVVAATRPMPGSQVGGKC